MFKWRNTPTEASYNMVQIDMFHEVNLYLPTRTIYFGGTFVSEDGVDSISIAQVIKNLQILEHKDQGKPITLILNSSGGSWFDGIGLYDIIRALKSPVNIIAYGKVMSMGAIILQAGNKRIMTKHTTFLMHDGTDGFQGTPKSFEAWADNSKITRKQSYEIFYKRMVEKNPKITLKKIEEMNSNDCILSAEQCLELGLIDDIMEDVNKCINEENEEE